MADLKNLGPNSNIAWQMDKTLVLMVVALVDKREKPRRKTYQPPRYGTSTSVLLITQGFLIGSREYVDISLDFPWTEGTKRGLVENSTHMSFLPFECDEAPLVLS